MSEQAVVELPIVLEAKDAAGHNFTYYVRQREVYAEGEGDPLFTHIQLNTSDELRQLVEGWRRGMIAGEKVGRALQQMDIIRALGLTNCLKADHREEDSNA